MIRSISTSFTQYFARTLPFLSLHFHFCFHPNVDSLLTAEATNSATLYELSSVTSEHIICSTRNQIIGYPVSATERVPSTPELRGIQLEDTLADDDDGGGDADDDDGGGGLHCHHDDA